MSRFVVIVNFRTAPLVIDCLASLEVQVAALRGGRVIVVDNDSGDGSAALIAAQIERRGWHWAESLPMPRNGGFAYGNNAGIARARALDPSFDTVVLLNPDTQARADAIERLAGFLDADPQAGIAGASIEDAAGHVEAAAHPDPSPAGELEGAAQWGPLSRWTGREAARRPATRAHRCDWVSGACMAIRRSVLDAVGPLDEDFFLYFEEVDYCVRARRAGWSCWYVPEARVLHFEGASTGITAARRRRPSYWYASRRRFFVKHYGIGGLLASDLLWAIGRLTLVLRRALRLGGRSGIAGEPTHLARDLLLGDLKAIWRGDLAQVARVARVANSAGAA